MAEHDSDPLSPEERAELEQLRAEKAARVAKEQARRERAELEALRAEKAHAKGSDTAASPKRAQAKPVNDGAAVPSKSKTSSASAATTRQKAPSSNVKGGKPAQKRDDMSFAVRMVTSTEPKDEDDIPGMAPAQKIIIVLALIAFVVFIGYAVLNSMGMLH